MRKNFNLAVMSTVLVMAMVGCERESLPVQKDNNDAAERQSVTDTGGEQLTSGFRAPSCGPVHCKQGSCSKSCGPGEDAFCLCSPLSGYAKCGCEETGIWSGTVTIDLQQQAFIDGEKDLLRSFSSPSAATALALLEDYEDMVQIANMSGYEQLVSDYTAAIESLSEAEYEELLEYWD